MFVLRRWIVAFTLFAVSCAACAQYPDKPVRLVMRTQEPLDVSSERRVIRARVSDERGAIAGREVQRCVEQGVSTAEPLRG